MSAKPLKWRVEFGQTSAGFTLAREGDFVSYKVEGNELDASGTASVVETAPGVFSVLIGSASYTVHVDRNTDGSLSVDSTSFRNRLVLGDERDRPRESASAATGGRVEIRSQMPGKIIKVLVEPGAAVEAGASLAVVEAMKMQNELKAPRAGVVAAVLVAEGQTVPAGQVLLAIE